MKKITPYIFLFLIFVNLFAPFTPDFKNKKLVSAVNKAEAAPENWWYETRDTKNPYKLAVGATTESMCQSIALKDPIHDWPFGFPNDAICIVESDYTLNRYLTEHDLITGDWYYEYYDSATQKQQNKLIPTATNYASCEAIRLKDSTNTTLQGFHPCFILSKDATAALQTPGVSVAEAIRSTTMTAAEAQAIADAEKRANDPMPACTFDSPATLIGIADASFVGCIAKAIYYVIFVPTSYVFALSGKFFDYTFGYSVNSDSYRSPFVTEGWGIVRDFCNMFFIFVLLYIAISTILDLHGFKTKEMIINVVIIGILINFSMLAAHLMIDASNILARVFYNNDKISITKDKNGVSVSSPGISVGENGELPLSEAIVNKIDPQSLIINGRKTIQLQDRVNQTQASGVDKNDLGVGGFILITLLASAVNVVGLIVFLSVGLIFIARIIGLWFAMIFAPLAFFSYTVPQMQNMKMFGWKNWWPETLSLCFLAPIFIFFMYLIIMFLDKGLSLINSNAQTSGLVFVISITVPFIFIMALMMKAKDMAKEYSGSLGQSITDGLSKVGGLALGAGVGVAAVAGRNTIGRVANKIDKSDWVNDAASGKKGRMAQFFAKDLGLKKALNYGAKASFDVRETAAGNEFSKQTGMNLNKFTSVVGLSTKNTVGGYVGAQERKVEREEKFGKSLGYNHHQYSDKEELISKKEDILAKYEAGYNEDGTEHGKSKKGPEFINRVAKLKYEIAGDKKSLERIETSREKEYALTVKRKSGKIYEIDQVEERYKEAKEEFEKDPSNVAAQKAFKDAQIYRDELGNIKKYGHAIAKEGFDSVAQASREAGEGFIKGAIAGFAVAGPLGAGIGGGIGALRNLLEYSGTTNQKVGAKHNKKDTSKSTYKEPLHTPPKDDGHAKPDSGHTEPAH